MQYYIDRLICVPTLRIIACSSTIPTQAKELMRRPASLGFEPLRIAATEKLALPSEMIVQLVYHWLKGGAKIAS